MKPVHSSQFTVHRKKTENRQLKTVNRPGQIILLSLVFLTFITMVSTALFARTAGYLRFGANNLRGNQARNLAEAAIEKALWQLNETAGEYDGETNTQLGTVGTFDIEITDKTDILKTITATGYVPNSSETRSKRTIKVDAYVNSSTVAFNYAVQLGTGGLSMSNSATVNGNVYTNGSITGANSALIKGDAYAVGTISNPPCTPPDCTEHELQPESQMPDITQQVSDWKAAADDNVTTCSPTCTINTSQSIGLRKYQGNLNITGNATVTITGPVWVTGNLSVTLGLTKVNLAESFGPMGTGFVVGGTISVTQGATFNPTSQTGYIAVVSESDASPAISVGNSGANAIFYTLGGIADLSNTASVKAIVAKGITMQQSSSLTYDTGLASTQFTSGPGGSWQPKKGTYRND